MVRKREVGGLLGKRGPDSKNFGSMKVILQYLTWGRSFTDWNALWVINWAIHCFSKNVFRIYFLIESDQDHKETKHTIKDCVSCSWPMSCRELSAAYQDAVSAQKAFQGPRPKRIVVGRKSVCLWGSGAVSGPLILDSPYLPGYRNWRGMAAWPNGGLAFLTQVSYTIWAQVPCCRSVKNDSYGAYLSLVL